MNWAEHHLVQTGDVVRVAEWQQYDWLIQGFSLKSAGNVDPRFGSVAAVDEARSKIILSLETKNQKWITMQQVHGADISEVSIGVDEPSEVDGMITTEPGKLLAVMIADCVPLLLLDPIRKQVSVIHAGRRGTQAEIAKAGVERMVEAGSKPENIQAAIGPSICPECYEINRETHGHYDLWQTNEDQLREAGVQTVIRTNVCTKEHNDLFFSYRGDNVEGRFAGLIGIT